MAQLAGSRAAPLEARLAFAGQGQFAARQDGVTPGAAGPEQSSRGFRRTIGGIDQHEERRRPTTGG